MALVLAIEPDHRQATTLKRVVREIVQADLVLVDSRDAAIAAINSQMPDVILVTALLSPRDEEELITHLRALDGAEHLQTHTIPQLAGSRGEPETREQRRRSARQVPEEERSRSRTSAAIPELFAEEIRTFLARAAQMKTEAVTTLRNRVAQLEAQVDDPVQRAGRSTRAAPVERSNREAPRGSRSLPQQTASGQESAWASPFEWRRSEASVEPRAQRDEPPPR